MGKPEGKRPLRRPGPNWEDNIKMNPVHVEWEFMYFINLGRDTKKWLAAKKINIRHGAP
jgi:hypothetical protein